MKKLRVFQTVKLKGIVPVFSLKNLGTVLVLVLFLPYLKIRKANNRRSPHCMQSVCSLFNVILTFFVYFAIMK